MSKRPTSSAKPVVSAAAGDHLLKTPRPISAKPVAAKQAHQPSAAASAASHPSPEPRPGAGWYNAKTMDTLLAKALKKYSPIFPLEAASDLKKIPKIGFEKDKSYVVALNINSSTGFFDEGNPNHWVGLRIRTNERHAIDTIEYLDPMGRKMSPALEKAIKKEIGPRVVITDLTQDKKIQSAPELVDDSGGMLVHLFRELEQKKNLLGIKSLKKADSAALGQKLRSEFLPEKPKPAALKAKPLPPAAPAIAGAEPDERKEDPTLQPQPKTKALLIVGPRIDIDFLQDNPNVVIVGDGKRELTLADIPNEHYDKVIIYAHGNEHHRNTPNETHTQTLFSDQPLTIRNILEVINQTTPNSLHLAGCYGGAVGDDIVRNGLKIIANMRGRKQPLSHMTISAIASSKHTVWLDKLSEYCLEVINSDNAKPWKMEIELARDKMAETLRQYHFIIKDARAKGDCMGEAKLGIFKIRSPKTLAELQNPEKFIGSSVAYGDKRGDKASRRKAQVVIERGFSDPDIKALDPKKMQKILCANDKTFSREYIQNAMLMAIERNKMDLFLEYLNMGADPTLADRFSGNTPLILAASEGKKEMVQELLRRKVGVDVANNQGWTPLYCAAQKGHVEIAQQLLDAQANVEAATKDGHTPLQTAADNGHNAMVAMLLAHNANVHQATSDGCTPLYLATQSGNVDIVQQLLRAQSNVETAKKTGATPLFDACFKGRSEVVKVLLDHKANPNTARKNGDTALRAASEQGHVGIVRQLLSAGADVNRRADEEFTTRTALDGAVICNKPEVVKLLIEGVDLPDGGRSAPPTQLNLNRALLFAAINGSVATAQELLSHGADICTTLNGDNILKVARNHNKPEMVNFLTEIIQRELCLAAEKGMKERVETFIKLSPDVNIPSDSRGITALCLAAQNGHIEVAQRLLAAGAVDTGPLDVATVKGESRKEIVQLLTDAKVKAKAAKLAKSLGEDGHLASAAQSVEGAMPPPRRPSFDRSSGGASASPGFSSIRQ